MDITKKQADMIRFMEDVMYDGMRIFKGVTKHEASKWIDEHKKEFSSKLFERQLDYEAELDIIDSRRDW